MLIENMNIMQRNMKDIKINQVKLPRMENAGNEMKS
jgi:hypothetical protein